MRALKAAQAAGFDDVLFLNNEEQVTETAGANVFIDKNGLLYTPPIECGLLAGVYRRRLLATRPDLTERILTLDDLKTADRVYVSNAVRGLREAEIQFDALV
jgi:para-aminobenzoate synthetase/4-amino-4-deoxychorismate lyase